MKLNKYQKRAMRTGDNVKLDEYQSGARSTAIYPGELMYPTLGLAGEAGELTKAVMEGDPVAISKEVGDVLWYVASVAADAGLLLSKIMRRKTFPTRKNRSCWGMDDALEELSIAVGVVAENVKKTIRDDAGVLGKKRRANIKKALEWVVYLLNDVCANVPDCPSLEGCAELNLEKLLSRQERGKLQGDGDNR